MYDYLGAVFGFGLGLSTGFGFVFLLLLRIPFLLMTFIFSLVGAILALLLIGGFLCIHEGQLTGLAIEH
jgi:hypothetical protein